MIKKERPGNEQCPGQGLPPGKNPVNIRAAGGSAQPGDKFIPAENEAK